MDKENPVACSLPASNLERRLADIAEIGADSLIDRHEDGGRHLLRFRRGATTCRRLEAIVAAEAECCSFLELSLSKEDDELVLSIEAPETAQAIADELAAAFDRGSAQRVSRGRGGR